MQRLTQRSANWYSREEQRQRYRVLLWLRQRQEMCNRDCPNLVIPGPIACIVLYIAILCSSGTVDDLLRDSNRSFFVRCRLSPIIRMRGVLNLRSKLWPGKLCFLLPSRTAVLTTLLTPALLIHGGANQPRLPHNPSLAWGIENEIQRTVLDLGLRHIPEAILIGSRNTACQKQDTVQQRRRATTRNLAKTSTDLCCPVLLNPLEALHVLSKVCPRLRPPALLMTRSRSCHPYLETRANGRQENSPVSPMRLYRSLSRWCSVLRTRQLVVPSVRTSNVLCGHNIVDRQSMAGVGFPPPETQRTQHCLYECGTCHHIRLELTPDDMHTVPLGGALCQSAQV